MQIKGFGKANLLIAAIKKVPSKAKPRLPKLAGKELFFFCQFEKKEAPRIDQQHLSTPYYPTENPRGSHWE